MLKKGLVLLSLSISSAYHNNKDSVTFSDREQTKTAPHWISAWSYNPMVKTTTDTATDAHGVMAALQ